MHRLLKISAVAGVTFMAGAPLAAWIVPQIARTPTNDAEPTREPALPADQRVVPIALTIEPHDLFNTSATLMARGLETDAEGASHTQILTIENGSARVLRTLQYCLPVAWSPVCDSVLLLRQAAPDDDLRHFTADVFNTTTEHDRLHLGCRNCRYESWRPDDAVVFDCDDSRDRAIAANPDAPITVVADTNSAPRP